jgi:peptidoglycan hydrolase CwlO-like protein
LVFAIRSEVRLLAIQLRSSSPGASGVVACKGLVAGACEFLRARESAIGSEVAKDLKEKASGAAEGEKDAEFAHEDYTLTVTELQIGMKFKRAVGVEQEVDSLSKETTSLAGNISVIEEKLSDTYSKVPAQTEEAFVELQGRLVETTSKLEKLRQRIRELVG